LQAAKPKHVASSKNKVIFINKLYLKFTRFIPALSL
jgi:hypothetical protein